MTASDLVVLQRWSGCVGSCSGRLILQLHEGDVLAAGVALHGTADLVLRAAGRREVAVRMLQRPMPVPTGGRPEPQDETKK